MLVGSPVRISSVGCESADIDGSCIPFQTTVTYLGVQLDQTLSMKQHISSLCNEQIARIQKIQNNAARLILKKSKRDHVTPLLKELF